jgi:hypothetical protein
MIHLGKVAYVTRMHTSDGCDGAAGPERLFTTGWSACFINVIRLAAGKIKLAVLPGVAVDAEVELGSSEDAYGLAACLNVSLPGVAPEATQRLVGWRMFYALTRARRTATSMSLQTRSEQGPLPIVHSRASQQTSGPRGGD